jgi:hypothetical protein
MMSRQERRKAESDAAKRAKRTGGARGAAGAAGAAGVARVVGAEGGAGSVGAGAAGGAAAARANVNVTPVGDWTTQASDPLVLLRALGANIVKQRAGADDREAQFSLGYWLVCESDMAAGMTTARVGASGRSSKADVGFAQGAYTRSLLSSTWALSM